jgi:sulfonate transport system substrate-binding protein
VTPPRRPRTRRALALALLAPLLLLSACGDDGSDAASGSEAGGGGGEVEERTLRVGFIGTKPDWGGPEGFFHAEGKLLEALEPYGVTEIESFQFGNGPDLNNALAGGSLDIGIYGDTPAINFRASGQETRVINQARVGLEANLFTPEGGAESLEDLDGGTIGVPQGSYMHRFVLGLLEEEGLADSVTVTNLLIPDAVAALQSGDVDAFAAPWSFVPVLEAQGLPELLSTFPDHPDLAGSSVTVVTEELLAADPDLVEGWNEARTAALELIAEDPEPYYDFQQPILDVPRELVPELEERLEGYPTEPFTDEGLELLEGTKQFLVDTGAAQSDFAIDEWQYIPGGS